MHLQQVLCANYHSFTVINGTELLGGYYGDGGWGNGEYTDGFFDEYKTVGGSLNELSFS